MKQICYFPLLLLFLVQIALTGCYVLRPADGGGQVTAGAKRAVLRDDIALPPGYEAEVVAQGLNFPTAATFDEAGNLYCIESGYSYGEVWYAPKLLRIENGNVKTIATGEKNGPWTGVTYYKEHFYVAEGGEAFGGKILRIAMSGDIKSLVDSLPSLGDHHTNGPVVMNGFLYFGQGTATNAAVVGADNADYGWLKRHPDFHDLPCKDIILTGVNYESDNPVSGGKAITGAYQSFNTATKPGQLVKGCLPCSGAIMRLPLNGGPLELVAWGLRNPYGLAVSGNKLYVTDNAFDVRGNRPVWGAPDVLWEIKKDAWYGFPDYAAGQPLAGNKYFKGATHHTVKALLQQAPDSVPAPVATLGVHSSSNGFDFAPAAFGYGGQAFIAQFGDMAPAVGKVIKPVGYKVIRVNVSDGSQEDFVVNKGKRSGPASWQHSGGLERPISVKFNPAGNALYIVDFGIITTSGGAMTPQPNTGVIWKITKTNTQK